MNVSDLIDRLAALDEAAPAQPEVDPDVTPEEPPMAPPAPSRPGPARRPAPNPWSVPPDFDPSKMPRPKSGDETESIQSWLEATQQPIQDWEWNGQELSLLMDDGSTETYTRQQLDEIGVFGEMGFAESLEDENFDPQAVEAAAEGQDEPMGPPEPSSELDPEMAQHLEMDDAGGTLDTILGRNDVGVGAGGEPGEPEVTSASVVIEVPPEDAAQTVSDIISAILGVEPAHKEGGETEEEPGEKIDGKIDGKSKSKKKKDSEKSKDSDSKETDEKDEPKEDDKKEDS